MYDATREHQILRGSALYVPFISSLPRLDVPVLPSALIAGVVGSNPIQQELYPNTNFRVARKANISV